MKEEIDVVIAGGASHVAALTFALLELDKYKKIMRVGGASAGAASAAGKAFSVPAETQRKLLSSMLTGDKLKDKSLWPPERYGIYKGDVLLNALADVFGKARMGDAEIPLRITVCDLWTRKPEVIDSEKEEHKKLKVVDVLRCSAAIPVFFKAWTLPEVWGNRLFVDGGTAANFALGMFDDSDRRTVGIRLAPKEPDFLKPVRSLADFAEAVAELVTYASDNAYISKKRYADVICIPQIGSGLDFNLSEKVINQRCEAGILAVRKAMLSAPVV